MNKVAFLINKTLIKILLIIIYIFIILRKFLENFIIHKIMNLKESKIMKFICIKPLMNQKNLLEKILKEY